MKKLLMLCYRAPYPLKSGSEIRMYQYIEILSRYFELDVLYLEETPPAGDMEPFYEKCGVVKKFRIPKWQRFLSGVCGYLFRGWPLQVGYFYSRKMQRYVNRHIGEYDAALCMHIRTIAYLLQADPQKRGQAALYFDGIDAISLNYKNNYLHSAGIRKLVNGMEYKRMERYEKMVYETVPGSILISKRDRDYIQKTLGADCAPTIIYNYAIDFGYQPEIPKAEKTMVFMGKMNYAPNVDAVLHFVEHVFLPLKKEMPGLCFRIVGGNASKEIEQLSGVEGIELCGFVDNPAEYLQGAAVVVAPMISGSGLQNKIVQAMYLGCMVVTTPIGADGLEDVSEREIRIAKDDGEMKQMLLHYLDKGAADERRQIGQAARAYIQKNYSFEVIEEQMRRCFDV